MAQDTMDVTMPDGRVITGVPVGITKVQLDMKLDTQFQDIVGKVLDLEGGYVNNPNDKGGETNFGISKRSYPDVDIKGLTKDAAKEIYYNDFYKKVGADKLSSSKALLMFDAAVNHGAGRAAKMAQRIIKTREDGIIGPKSLGALNSTDDASFAEDYLDSRKALYDKIIDRDSSQEVFRDGWYNRLSSVANDLNIQNYNLLTPPTTTV